MSENIIRPIRRLLVANRGEIAIRIFRACTELGIHTVGIYAHEDRSALHRVKADESYPVGAGRGPVAAYLDIEGILEVAQRAGVDAIHPGYGFLAENAAFARACFEAGIRFVGPDPEHLDVFGDKAAARRTARQAGLPLLPGSEEPFLELPAIVAEAQRIGYPVMVKPVFGGGGRGIRLARDEKELRAVVESAQSEAGTAFGMGSVYLEMAVERPRHIEVQVLGDAHGNLVHLFERDCSLQRRHQKVVEVAPAVGLAADVRARICDAAAHLMRSLGYRGAGTVEFLVLPDGRFFFMEVNPRIQVEHTVTELVTTVDLVQAQIRVAEGYRLSDPEIGIASQSQLECRGVAIQCRVTSEDPKNGFLPNTGRILTYRSPGGLGIRLDGAGAEAGAVITPHYDSLLVKCTAWAPTFSGAVVKMRRALGEFRIRGVRTNLRFLLELTGHPDFRAGRTDTGFIDRTPELVQYVEPRDRGNKLLAYLADVTVNGNVTVTASRPRFGGAKGTQPVPGLRPLLLGGGPRAVVERLREDPRLWLTDTTFRDAHQSLLAARMRTRDLVDAAAVSPYLGGVFSLEMWGGATFDTALRFLHESPWARLDALRQALPNTLFQMLLRGSNAVGYASYPDNVVTSFVRASAEAGIDVFRIFDSLNWVDGMRVAIEAALETGRLVEGTICYTGDCADPTETLYTIDYYLDMARRLCALGVHMIAIKDMAGLLRPAAAARLITALKSAVDVPIHLHTHDTAGWGIASILEAAQAGVDIADVAVASMSGGTSQPSLSAAVAALRGTRRDTRMDLAACDQAAAFWAERRPLYGAFEAPPGASGAGALQSEMPGGQYTSLFAQAETVGLAARWPEVVAAYREVDRLLGRIVKVTPSSKAVGDFALFLVQQDLSPADLSEATLSTPEGRARAARLDFPQSVRQLLAGEMGQPPRPFPPHLRDVVLRGATPIAGRLGALKPPVDLDAVKERIQQRTGQPASLRDALTEVLYPDQARALALHLQRFGDTSGLDTVSFFAGMRPGDEIEVEIERGKTLVIRLVAIGSADSDGRRVVHFELNGTPRAISTMDRSVGVGGTARPVADPADPDQVPSPMPGTIARCSVRRGDRVRRGDALVVIEAMKLETIVHAPHDGEVTALPVVPGDPVRHGDLVAVVRASDA